jgi:hypothetical protein
MKSTTQVLAAFVVALTFNFSVSSSHAKDPLGQRWSKESRVSMNKVSHKRFDILLKKYVDEDGYVAYSKFKASGTDRKELQTYLAELGQASISKPAARSSQIAFWINAYNAVTLEGILQEYPTSSIRNHTAKVFGYNIWKNLPIIVGEKTYTLEEIEHSILRKVNEPRIHFAIVCASVGCPRLLNSAYTGSQLEAQLILNSKDFFSRSKNFRISEKSNRLYLSSIIDWFAEDFGENDQERLKAIEPYLPASAQYRIQQSDLNIRFLDYDWSLNDQKSKKE